MASPPKPATRAMMRKPDSFSLSRNLASSVAHNAMVYPMMTDLPACMRAIPWAEHRCQPVTFNSETRTSGSHSDLGTVNRKPLDLARAIIPRAPKAKERVLKVQGGISLSATFMTGHASPQKRDSPASSK